MCRSLLHKWGRKCEAQRKKHPWYCDGNFVLQERPSRVGGKQEDFSWMPRKTESEDPMVILHEMKLVEKVLLTDTVDDHDTLTVSPSLLEDPTQFYTIGQQLAGGNFLKTPYTINVKPRYGEKKQGGVFTTHTPPWLNVKTMQSVAKLILFYLERALWFQFEAHCL